MLLRIIPIPTLERLFWYIRLLEDMRKEGKLWITSKELADAMGIKPTQVRKDLSLVGKVIGTLGKKGAGYEVDLLLEKIKEILGLSKIWRIALVGVGNLGRALLRYPLWRKEGFEIVVAFDRDPSKWGTEIGGVPIYPIDDFEKVVKEKAVDFVVLTVHPDASQEIYERARRAGLKGLVNFSPKPLQDLPNFKVVNVEISDYFRKLAVMITLSTHQK